MNQSIESQTPSPFVQALSELPPPKLEFRREVYEIAGKQWWRYENGERLSCALPDDRFIELGLGRCGHWQWYWCQRIAEGVYVRGHGGAENLGAAAEAAIRLEPQRNLYEYLGQVQWYSTTGKTWAAAIDGDEAEVIYVESDTAERYLWRRKCAAAAAVLSLCEEPRLGGAAPTLEAAMRACVDAPERLKLACGAYVARMIGPVPAEGAAS